MDIMRSTSSIFMELSAEPEATNLPKGSEKERTQEWLSVRRKQERGIEARESKWSYGRKQRQNVTVMTKASTQYRTLVRSDIGHVVLVGRRGFDVLCKQVFIT